MMNSAQIQNINKVVCEICGKAPSPYPNWLLDHGHANHVGCLATAYRELANETRRVTTALQNATNELMTEFVSGKRAANWLVINEAGVQAQNLLVKLTPE